MKEMSMFKRVCLLIVCLSISLVNVTLSLGNTALADIKVNFPDAAPAAINMVSTLPSLMVFLCSLFVGYLATKIDKRTLVIVALALTVIGGCGGTFLCHSITQILIMRAISGLGAGISTVISVAVIKEVYDGPQLTKVLGWNQSWDSILMIVISYLAGRLTLIGWNWIFMAYGVFFILLIMAIYALPKMPPSAAATAQYEEEKARKASAIADTHLSRTQLVRLVIITIFVFVSRFGTGVMNLKLVMHIVSTGIGTPADFATAMSFTGLVTALIAFCFPYIYKVTKKYTLVIYFLLLALGFFVILNAQSMASIYVAVALSGAAAGLFIVGLQTMILSITPNSPVLCMQIITGALFAGNFCTTWVDDFFGLFMEPTIVNMYQTAMIAMVVLAVLYAIYATFTKSVEMPQKSPRP